MSPYSLQIAQAILLFSTTAVSQGCSNGLSPRHDAPVVGSGWIAQLVVNNLKSPRSIMFDNAGGLLVVQQGEGIQRITFKAGDGVCLTVDQSTTVVDSNELNHGIELSEDGRTLFASSASSLYSWPYDPSTGTTTGERATLVSGMEQSGHSSRTLLLARNTANMPSNATTMLISRGSGPNIDPLALDRSSGRSQLKAFDLTALAGRADRPYDYSSEGTLVGWGLRNSVGVAEEPTAGGIFTVENSADQVQRMGQDVHRDTPGEEMNYHGTLSGGSNSTVGGRQLMGANYGYPSCLAVWDTNIPEIGNMKVGDQFTPSPNDTFSDATCASEYISPRLTFQAHTAPLDIKFAPDGSEAYVTFHGSWNRDEPAGYYLGSLAFSSGQPIEPSTSTTASRAVLSNADVKSCPGSCFRPVGIAIDPRNSTRIFMTSDSTGEIYALQKVEMSAGTAGGGGGSGGGSGGTSLAARSGRNQLGREGVFAAILCAMGCAAVAVVGLM